MILRTGVPFIAAVMLTASSPTLREGGFFGATVVFYLLTLSLETLFSVRLISTSGVVPGAIEIHG